MEFDLHDARNLLGRTPATLNGLLRGSTPQWHDAREGEGTWSPREVVAHLAQLEETDWIARARRILDEGESRAFDPVIRDAHLERHAGWSVDALIDRFTELRRANIVEIERWALTPEQLGLAGKHPSFGRVTLAQLLAAWCVHDLTHVAQIVRVMARQYDSAVGPWTEYLSILKWK
jgi:uncharacterized damage-inducible protein DinB